MQNHMFISQIKAQNPLQTIFELIYRFWNNNWRTKTKKLLIWKYSCCNWKVALCWKVSKKRQIKFQHKLKFNLRKNQFNHLFWKICNLKLFLFRKTWDSQIKQSVLRLSHLNNVQTKIKNWKNKEIWEKNFKKNCKFNKKQWQIFCKILKSIKPRTNN